MGFGHSYHRFFLMLKQQSRQGNDTAGMVIFCHNQTHTLLTKALMTAGSLKCQNGNSDKNITLKIIDFTFFQTPVRMIIPTSLLCQTQANFPRVCL